MKRPVSLSKLSQLQRLILVMLLEAGCERLRRRQFRDLVKRLYWGSSHAKASACSASLSRALSALEARRYLERTRSGWRLSDSESDLVNNGYIFAVLAWQRAKELYALLGLRGPAPTQKSPGVHVELHF
jgi:hypothetical protein